jgi:hypothetical protein
VFIVVSMSSDLAVMHSSLFRNTKDCLTVSRRRLPIPTLQNTVEMDAAQREAESLGQGSRVVCTCVRSMDTLGFPLREWRLLTAS